MAVNVFKLAQEKVEGMPAGEPTVGQTPWFVEREPQLGQQNDNSAQNGRERRPPQIFVITQVKKRVSRQSRGDKNVNPAGDNGQRQRGSGGQKIKCRLARMQKGTGPYHQPGRERSPE